MKNINIFFFLRRPNSTNTDYISSISHFWLVTVSKLKLNLGIMVKLMQQSTHCYQFRKSKNTQKLINEKLKFSRNPWWWPLTFIWEPPQAPPYSVKTSTTILLLKLWALTSHRWARCTSNGTCKTHINSKVCLIYSLLNTNNSKVSHFNSLWTQNI